MAEIFYMPMTCIRLELQDDDKVHTGGLVYHNQSKRILMIEGNTLSEKFMYKSIDIILRGLLTMGWKITEKGIVGE